MDIVTDKQELAPTIAALVDPRVACNEYPNPPWNTVTYEWNAVYPERSPEWYAQTTAKIALATGLRYTVNVDQYGRPAQARGQAIASATTGQGIEQAPIACLGGVVDDTHVYFVKDGSLTREPLPEVKNVGDLLQCCYDRGLDVLWIVAETQLSERATPDFMESEEWHIQNIQYPKGPSLWDDDKKRATFLRAWKKPEYRAQGQAGKEQGRNLYLGYAEHEVSYGFDKIKNPLVLLAAISYLEDAIDAPLRFSAQSTGKYTMRKATENHKAWIAPVTLPAQVRGAANDCIWRRELLPEEIEAGGYVVTADKNSQYMAGCTSVALGEGEPEYLSGAEIETLAKLPTGRYYIRLSGSSQFDGVMLPHPTDGALESWQYVYTVMLAREIGYHVEIIEGYVWRHGRAHTTLRTWAENLWASRAALKTNERRYSNSEARHAAYKAVNTVIRGGMGMLDHPPEYNSAIAQTWYRPDWYALIIDIAKYKMFAVIKKYLALGKRPIAIYTDCLYYTGQTDNHEIELPGMYERAGKLGGFKRKYARAISVAQVAPMFANKRMDIQAINLQLLAYDRGDIEL